MRTYIQNLESRFLPDPLTLPKAAALVLFQIIMAAIFFLAGMTAGVGLIIAALFAS